MTNSKYPDQLVFGLDIGTRSIVGTVGYKDSRNRFQVVAQVIREHETRAMLDGQIHDIQQVSATISEIKIELEKLLGITLKDVCIAAAGRVLKTVTVEVTQDLESEMEVDKDMIHALDLLGVEKAYQMLREENNIKDIKFYCVGYSVVKYYLNDSVILNLLGHKAYKIGTELLATFLPEEVIDGLYSAVNQAGLNVANLTLEPIAAIQVAIPEKFRLLNLALVDVGAGTSDICITKDGSITAYGMIPCAGDELTEQIARAYLVDFETAEQIKTSLETSEVVSYEDIIGISHEVTKAEVLEQVDSVLVDLTKSIADKIVELNGGKPVSAVFIVGGGGRLDTFTTHIAEYLKLNPERVALRGKEVLGEVDFLQEDVQKDSLLVTPIGICLNYYEAKNNFIFVNVNGERIKLYDNNRLTIVDAAIQYGLLKEDLFPKRGNALEYTVNGEKRLQRGLLGEAAVICRNGNVVGMTSEIAQNDIIEITISTVGENANLEVRKLPEYNDNIQIRCNDKIIVCPRFVTVNDKLVSGYYSIETGDAITVLNYYTLEQLLEFMDLPFQENITINNVTASLSDCIYNNFSVIIPSETEGDSDKIEEIIYESVETNEAIVSDTAVDDQKQSDRNTSSHGVQVTVNDSVVLLTGKESYILVDILDFYPFDIQEGVGKSLILQVNDQLADFTTKLNDYDQVKIYWKE